MNYLQILEENEVNYNNMRAHKWAQQFKIKDFEDFINRCDDPIILMFLIEKSGRWKETSCLKLRQHIIQVVRPFLGEKVKSILYGLEEIASFEEAEQAVKKIQNCSTRYDLELTAQAAVISCYIKGCLRFIRYIHECFQLNQSRPDGTPWHQQARWKEARESSEKMLANLIRTLIV